MPMDVNTNCPYLGQIHIQETQYQIRIAKGRFPEAYISTTISPRISVPVQRRHQSLLSSH
jgi:hypothetical protein